MSLRRRSTRFSIDAIRDAFLGYMILREIAKGALWLRNWWRGLSAFDRWTTRVAAAHTLIAGLPGVLLGVLVALALSGPMPQPTNPYAFNWQVSFFFILASVTVLCYLAIRIVVLDRFRDLLGLRASD